MAKFSSDNLQRQLAVIVDGVVISAPTIQSQFSDRFQITGDFNEEELQFLAASLRSARPLASLEPKPISEEKVAAGSEK
jgi:preprotein translocase subunit SecD